MKLSKPGNFERPHLIYDPVRKDALVIDYDQIIVLPGPFATYDEALAHFARRRGDLDGNTDPPQSVSP